MFRKERRKEERHFLYIQMIQVGCIVFGLLVAVIIAISLINTNPDYLSASEFRDDIFAHTVSEGDTGRLVAQELEPNLLYGMAIEVAENVYLVGPQGQDIPRGSILEFEVVDYYNLFGSYMVEYRLRGE